MKRNVPAFEFLIPQWKGVGTAEVEQDRPAKGEEMMFAGFVLGFSALPFPSVAPEINRPCQ